MNDNFIIISNNKKVKRNYHIIETIISGLVLHGWEVRSIKNHSISIDNSYVYFENGEFYVFEMNISPLSTMKGKKINSRKRIKILLKKKEIKKIINELKIRKISLIVTRILIIKGWIKLEFSKAVKLRKYQIRKEDKLKEEFKKNEKNKLFSS